MVSSSVVQFSASVTCSQIHSSQTLILAHTLSILCLDPHAASLWVQSILLSPSPPQDPSPIFFLWPQDPCCFSGWAHPEPAPLTSLSSAELEENIPLNGAVAWPVQTNPCKILDAKLQLISTEAVWNWNFSSVYNVPKFGHLFSRIARGTCWHTQHHLCQMSCPAP